MGWISPQDKPLLSAGELDLINLFAFDVKVAQVAY